jgi:hypothetical protein
MGDRMRLLSAAAVLCLFTACSHSKENNEPAKATMTATGDTEINRTAQAGDEPVTVVPECKKVVSCYNALSRDLCTQSTEDCTASFRVTTPVDKPETCKRLLDQASETAKPFMANPKYKMPTECG